MYFSTLYFKTMIIIKCLPRKNILCIKKMQTQESQEDFLSLYSGEFQSLPWTVRTAGWHTGPIFCAYCVSGKKVSMRQESKGLRKKERNGVSWDFLAGAPWNLPISTASCKKKSHTRDHLKGKVDYGTSII